MATYLYQSPFRQGIALVQNQQEKYGFINQDNVEFVPCQYDSATMFSSGVARVAKDGLWGLVDTAGKEIVPPQYESIAHALQGCLVVMHGEKTGVLNSAGKEIVPIEYDELEDCDNGKLWLAYNVSYDESGYPNYVDYTLYNTAGKKIIAPNKYTEMQYLPNNTFWVKTAEGTQGVVDTAGRKILPTQYQYVVITESDCYVVSKNEKYGILDAVGKAILPLRYEAITFCYHNEDIVAPYLIVHKKNGIRALYDSAGKEILPFVYTDIWVKSPTQIIFKTAEKTYLGDHTGTPLSPPDLAQLSFMSEGYLAYTTAQIPDKWGIMNYSFERLTEQIFDEIMMEEAIGDCITVSQMHDNETRQALYHLPTLQTRTPFEYEAIYPLYMEDYVIFWTQNKARYGIIDSEGKTLFPCIYRDLRVAHPHNILLKDENHKEGLMSIEGEVIIPFEYDEIIGPDADEMFLVRNKYYFDTKGNPLPSKPYFAQITELTFSEGYAIAGDDSGWGYLDSRYEWAIPPVFETAYAFQQGLAVVKQNELWGVINTKGEWIIPAQYEYLQRCEFDATYFTGFGKEYVYGLLNAQNEVVVPFVSSSPIEKKDDWVRYQNEENDYVLQNLQTHQKMVFQHDEPYLFSEKLALCRNLYLNTYHFINEKGKSPFVIVYNLQDGEAFQMGTAMLWRYDELSGMTEYYVFDTKGELLFEKSLLSLSRWTKNVFYGTDADYKYSFFNLKGEMLIPETFDFITILSPEKALLERIEDDKRIYYLFDVKLKKLKKLPYYHVSGQEGCSVLKVGKQFAKHGDTVFYGLIDFAGKTVLHCLYLELEVVKNNYVLVKTKEPSYCGAFDMKGDVIVGVGYEDFMWGTNDLIVMYKQETLTLPA